MTCVVGGFGLPIARDMCQKVIRVGSNDLQSLYVANNVCSGSSTSAKLVRQRRRRGHRHHKDDGTGEAAAFAEAAGIRCWARSPADEDIRRKSANYEIVGRPDGRWGSHLADLAEAVAAAPPERPKPLTQDGLLNLFSGDTVGRNVVLSLRALRTCAAAPLPNRQSLEVIYDTV